MIYSLLRGIAGVALRWYYADVTVVGDERQASDGPLLVVVNHPNALIDVLVAGRAVPRRLMFTAKATLFSNPIASALLKGLGVLPLRRASDETGGAAFDRTRNAAVFEAITDALARRRAVLIFPEGKSHDEPALAPLRSGAARMALSGRDSGRVHGLKILPIGLIFEQKDTPRTRILAIIGDTLDIDSWRATDESSAPAELTAAIDARLRSITLNYASPAEAARDHLLSEQIAAILRFEAPSVGAAGDLREKTAIAQTLPAVRAALLQSTSEMRTRATAYESSLESLRQSLAEHAVSIDDVTISRSVRDGAWFVVREGLIVLGAGPIAVWGWANHLIPFRAAFAMGRRVRETAADPAMRTILAGLAFVLMVYMLQGALVGLFAGPAWGVAYVLSLPIAADINLRVRDRLERARRRARAYLLFRSHADWHDRLEQQILALRAETLALVDASGVTNAR